MRLIVRVSRFVSIGLVSTIVHYLTLGLFIWLNLELWIANLFAFTLAFLLSFSWQQRYAFGDRLGSNSRFNKKALIILFLANLILSGVSAGFIGKQLVLALPLLPALFNYWAYYLMSGSKVFKAKA